MGRESVRSSTNTNSRPVCSDRQLLLCATPTEGTLPEGKHSNSKIHCFLTGMSGRVSGHLHLHPRCCHRRIFSQHLRYALRSRCSDRGYHTKALHRILYYLCRWRFHPDRAIGQPTWSRLGLCGCRLMRSLWYGGTYCMIWRASLICCRRVHCVVHQSTVDTTYNGMDKNVHRMDHLSNHCRELVLSLPSISPFVNTVLLRSSSAQELAK